MCWFDGCLGASIHLIPNFGEPVGIGRTAHNLLGIPGISLGRFLGIGGDLDAHAD
jgi:hypothetical protein